MTCLLCQSAEFTELFRGIDRLYHTTAKRFPVVRCRNCGLVRMEPIPSPEELAAYYPRHYWFRPERSLAGWLEEHYRRLLLKDHIRFVRRALQAAGERGPVLDVGCGGGLFLRLLKEQGTKVIGLDLSPEAAGVAWHYNGVPTLCGDLAHVPLPPQSCSAVTMFHVVEHLSDPHAYLRSVHHLLRPEGRLIIQVPNIDCWQFALLRSSWNGVDVPRHLYDFRPEDLKRLLAACGFEVVRTKLFSWRDNPAGLATSLAPALEPVARKVRGTDRGTLSSLWKDALYLGLVIAAVPFTVLEALFGAGSTVMVEARKIR